MPNLFLDLRNVLVSASVKVVGGRSPSVSKMLCVLKFLSRRFVRTRQGRCPLACRAIPPMCESMMPPTSILDSTLWRRPCESLEAALSLRSS